MVANLGGTWLIVRRILGIRIPRGNEKVIIETRTIAPGRPPSVTAISENDPIPLRGSWGRIPWSAAKAGFLTVAPPHVL